MAQSGHPGGALSSAEILSILWMEFLDYRDDADFSSESNRLVLSKGHSVPALYALASLTGNIGWDECQRLRQLESRAQGHPHVGDFWWLETSTGSLGQGFSFSAGVALSKKLLSQGGQVFCLLGDGELQEGQVWEAFMFAAHKKLSNLVVIVDRNRLQSDNSTEVILGLEPLKAKVEAFGWDCVEVDGHDNGALSQAIENFTERPKAIIANTSKGKGVTFMEDVASWHGSVAMTEEQYFMAAADLGFSGGYASSLLRKGDDAEH